MACAVTGIEVFVHATGIPAEQFLLLVPRQRTFGGLRLGEHRIALLLESQQHFRWQRAGLPERERLVLALYYDEEMNLKEIGMTLGVTESRVCQICNQAMSRLRARLQDWS